ncbi:hypothetical protein ACFV0T_35490 [Streptomyces sp. NPDC059582]|uniref:hypothetical protein n=1 Tax=Streptomyces sp. NPDC059582 TaxID=3346875 RepID=UPI0036774A1D
MAEHKSGQTKKSMDPAKQRENASRENAPKEGHAPQDEGTTERRTSEETREAGHKSGKASQEKRHH